MCLSSRIRSRALCFCRRCRGILRRGTCPCYCLSRILVGLLQVCWFRLGAGSGMFQQKHWSRTSKEPCPLLRLMRFLRMLQLGSRLVRRSLLCLYLLHLWVFLVFG